MVSFFWPEICPVCLREGNALNHQSCRDLLEQERLSPAGRCQKCFFKICNCRRAFLFYDTHRALYKLTPVWQKVLSAWKFKGQRSLYRLFLSSLQEQLSFLPAYDTIAITRNGRNGFNKRSFEPLYDLARSLACRTGSQISGVWRKKGGSQKDLARRDRHFAMPGSFSAGSAGSNCLLIDDVFSTGATANEIARILKNNGAKTVSVLSLLLNDDFEAVNGFATDKTGWRHKNNSDQRSHSAGRFSVSGRCAG